ncbi:hypothetical protein [Streptomyces sp. NPDC021212]|uniref:hypothetical protein n=1 Tax=Streptomyces sp. NPDC021212 TaxID=3365118 RepID=UPI00379DC972
MPAALQRADGPVAAAWVRERLDGDLAYDRGAVPAGFVTGLTADDERLLRGLLSEAEGS